jgi:hypothetical protein
VIENLRDVAATKAARKAGEIHAPSFISIAGHVYLFGKDVSAVRLIVRTHAGGYCYLCGKFCADWDGDLEHLKSGRFFQRCFCFGRTLADGTICSNLGWAHSTRSVHPCHRDKHNREVHLRTLK